jgi:uncharacterized protein YqgC (DUF456 family)
MSQTMLGTIMIMGIGLVGAVLPFVPGPPIIWLGALYYAWRTGWTEVGWPVLTLLLILAIAGGTADLWMGYLGAYKGGASGLAALASIVGGVVGLLLFSLPGAILGSIGAILLVEFLRHRGWRSMLRASGGYLVGWLLATVVEIVICLLMIGIFVIAVYV